MQPVDGAGADVEGESGTRRADVVGQEQDETVAMAQVKLDVPQTVGDAGKDADGLPSEAQLRSETSTSVVEAASSKALLPTFYLMTGRRLRRVLEGQAGHRGSMARTFGNFRLILIIVMFLYVLGIEVPEEKRLELVWLPCLITAFCVLLAFRDCKCGRKSRLFTTFWQMQLNIVSVWLIWEFGRRPGNVCGGIRMCFQDWTKWSPFRFGGTEAAEDTEDAECFTPQEQACLLALLWCAAGSFLIHLAQSIMVPVAIRNNFWHQGSTVFFQIQTTKAENRVTDVQVGPGNTRVVQDRLTAPRYSYRPFGCCNRRRRYFGYVGELDSKGRPHGKGLWFDDSFNGECMEGHWNEGMPSRAFSSREFGTGAIFRQRAVGYATSRKDCQPDDLSASTFFPDKEDKLRYGLAQVEVSCAGGFFPFLPAIGYSETAASMRELRQRMDEPHMCGGDSEDAAEIRLAVGQSSTGRPRSPSRSMPRIQSGTEGSEDELAEDKHLILKVCCPADNSDPYVIRTDTVDRFLSRKKEAMVFFHGYNCPLADCLGRVAQFFALGGMPPHIVPFVFSFAAGGPVSYSWVVDGFHKYSDNLCEFFTELGDVYHDIHVVGHSCGAFAFMMNWHAIEGCFAECHPGPRHRIETEATSCSAALPRLRTVTLINPDVLFCTVAKALPSMMRRVERFTSYNDRLDQALFYSGFVRNLLGARVLCPEQQPDPNYPLLIWGACVTPIIVEEASGDSMGCTRCPLLDSGKRIGKTFGCLPQTGNIIDFGSNGDQLPVHSRIDIIDCSTMQQNVHSLRHNYYMLNTQIVEDICEVIGRRLPATARSRLTRAQGNVFNFLCPPADIDEL